jgi:DNA-binding NarL/FixJ family response regulator
MTTKIRVMLADDHPIFLTGLRNVIAAERELELVGEATNGLTALNLIFHKQPDIAILDISMPGLNGIEVARRTADECPSVRVLALTLHEDRAFVTQALQAGVRGYLLKRSAAEYLTLAITAVHRGAVYMDPALAIHAIADPSAAGPGPSRQSGAVLTDRETEVLRDVAFGFTNKEISSRLDVSVKSVETYRARAAEKLGLRTRAEIVRFASAQGWLAQLPSLGTFN